MLDLSLLILSRKLTNGLAIDLEIIAVKPDYQRLGVGTMLVRWGTERAAAAGHDVIHLASHSSKKLCETLGFEDSMTVSLEFHGDMYYPMKKRAS